MGSMESMLTHPVGQATKNRVTWFGIELEVLSGSDRRIDEPEYSLPNFPTLPRLPDRTCRPEPGQYVDHPANPSCTCYYCSPDRWAQYRCALAEFDRVYPNFDPAAAQAEWDAVLEVRRRLERDHQTACNRARRSARWRNPDGTFRTTPTTAKTLEFLGVFREHGLTNLRNPHDYHCRCATCDYSRSTPAFTAQHDSTVGIEFISKILHAGTADAEIVERAIEAYAAGMKMTGFKPQEGACHGNHIHVSNMGTDDGKGVEFRPHTQGQARMLLDSVMESGNFAKVADGGVGFMRGYNTPPQKSPLDRLFGGSPWGDYYSGSWMGANEGTFEFRLWNTPAEPERIAAHIGLSIALTRWAYKQVIVNRSNLSISSNAKVREQLVKFGDDVKEVLADCVPAEFAKAAAPRIEELVFA